MVWLTWRQHRAQLLCTLGLLLLLGAFAWWNGSKASASLTTLGDGNATTGQIVLGWLPFAAALVGVFWGAPVLAREFERGTHRLAWTQSVSPLRWITVKLGGLGLAVTLCGLALGGMMSAWLAAWDNGRPIAEPGWFTVSGVVPAAWWLFLFAAGTAAGALLHRTLPAMAVTIAVFGVATYLLFTYRVDYAAPERLVEEGVWVSSPVPDRAMITNGAWLGPDGREVESVHELWTEPDAPCRLYDPMQCIRELGYRQVIYFHPPSRYWRFQWTESAILLAGAAVLLGVTVYRVAHRPRVRRSGS